MNIHRQLQQRMGLLKKVCIVLVVLGLGLSFWLLAQRVMVEQDYSNVEVAVEHLEIREMARQNDMTFAETLQLYREAGVTSLFVKELSFPDYGNEIWYQSGSKLRERNLPAEAEKSYVVTADPGIAENISLNMEVRGLLEDEFSDGDLYYIGTHLPLNQLWSLSAERVSRIRETGLGWPLEDMKTAEDMGLWLQLQMKDWQPLTQESIDLYFSQLETFDNVSVFLFNSSNLFGFEDTDEKYLENFVSAAQEIKRMDAPIAQVEFFRQRGFHYMSEVMEHDVIRLHSISASEQRRLGPQGSIERMNLAAKDRNMRSLLARQFVTGDGNDLETNLTYVENLTDRLEKEGFVLNRAQSLPAFSPAPWQVMLLAAAVLAGGVLLALRLKIPLIGIPGFAAGLALAALLIAAGRISWAQKLFALGGVIIFPVLSVDTFVREKPRKTGQALVAFLLVSAVSLVGAFLMIGLLADRQFMLYLDSFTGVKISHVLPMAGIVLMYFAKKNFAEIKKLLRSFWNAPLTIKMLAFVLLGGIILFMYVMRTGNESVAVTNIELLVRNRLENLTGARPRTKEFLIGHPLMILTLYLGLSLKKLPLVVGGIIGQISIVNTYAHIHTPVLISISRSAWGLVLGILAGVLLIFLWKQAENWKRRLFDDE